jgi:hypothetical protein
VSGRIVFCVAFKVRATDGSGGVPTIRPSPRGRWVVSYLSELQRYAVQAVVREAQACEVAHLADVRRDAGQAVGAQIQQADLCQRDGEDAGEDLRRERLHPLVHKHHLRKRPTEDVRAATISRSTSVTCCSLAVG